MNIIENLNLEEITANAVKKSIQEVNADYKKIINHLDKHKNDKFKVGQIIRRIGGKSYFDNVFNTKDYYVVSAHEYNPSYTDEKSYYLVRLDENTLLGEQESKMEAVTNIDFNDLPDAVKKFKIYVGGVFALMDSFI